MSGSRCLYPPAAPLPSTGVQRTLNDLTFVALFAGVPALQADRVILDLMIFVQHEIGLLHGNPINIL